MKDEGVESVSTDATGATVTDVDAAGAEGAARATLRCSGVAKMETRLTPVLPASLRVALLVAGARVRKEECTPA